MVSLSSGAVVAVILAASAGAFTPPRQLASSRCVVPAVKSRLFRRASSVTDDTDVNMMPSVVPSSGAAHEEDSFDWYKSWYPIVPVEYLDKEKPHKFTLLGMDLVVWNDEVVGEGKFASKKTRSKKTSNSAKGEGQWRAFADECPHRKVPLSEGRKEDDGSLLCSYHAWRFDGEGGVVSVPQAQENELEKVRVNPKSRCNAFPVKVVSGLLWVWPESGENSILESELTRVPAMELPHEIDDTISDVRVVLAPWNFRQLPYGHDYFIENVVDPAHVPASHHNIVGDRYNGPQPMEMTHISPITRDGFAIKVKSSSGEFSSNTEFIAPCLVKITQPVDDDGSASIIELYSSPSTPGFCNHIGRQVIVKTKDGKVPSIFKRFLIPMPLWLLHILSNTFLNQDALFLHAQERNLAKNGMYSSNLDKKEGKPNHYTKAVLPISSDKGVISFRNWLRKKAGGRIPYKGNPAMPAVDNEAVFDTYRSHTKNCVYCRDALRRLRKVRYGAYISAALLAAVRPKPLGIVGATALAAMFGGVGIVSNKLMKMMHRMEFSHAEND